MKSRMCLIFYITVVFPFLKIVTVSSLKISVSTMTSLTDTHMITFTHTHTHTHNIIPIIQAQISIHLQGHQCTTLFPIYPDVCELEAVVLFLHHAIPFLYLFLYLPSSFFTYHPLSLPTILSLCCTVLVLHHPLSLPTIHVLYLSSSFQTYHPLSLLYCPRSTPYNPLSSLYCLLSSQYSLYLFLYLPSSFFTYHPLSLPTILSLCCTVLVLHHPLSLPIILFLYLPSTFFTYHPLSRPTILFLCCTVLVLHHTILFLHCTVCCLHSILFGWGQSSKGLQNIFSNSTSLFATLQPVFTLVLSLFHLSFCIELTW